MRNDIKKTQIAIVANDKKPTAAPENAKLSTVSPPTVMPPCNHSKTGEIIDSVNS